MIRALLLWLLTGLVAGVYAQTINVKAFDTKSNSEILTGYCTREGFACIKNNFDSVYRVGYANYIPDSTTLAALTHQLKRVKITVAMATWCSDSRDWVPALYKILDLCEYNYNNLTLICVDRERKAPNTHVEELDILKVPTFIFYKRKHELGRIIEVPTGVLEKDILSIVTNSR
jgi:hypothetical protein